tara:strand:- start:129 stop:602 length:474 start_codon:yes stop_codon:yes gene_type:complete
VVHGYLIEVWVMNTTKLTHITKSLILIPILYAFISCLYFVLFWPKEVQITHLAGVVITTLAFTLWIVARVQLGNAFSVMPKAKFLVKSGIYSRLRHPVYYFSLLALAGIALFSMSWYVFALLAILTTIQRIRINKEEKVLMKKFGKEYIKYKEVTWF